MDRDVFKHLAVWNQSMEDALDVLSKLAEQPELRQEDFAVERAYVQERLASVNLNVLHFLAKSEQKMLSNAFKERRAYEKKVRDPDDCYFEVARREEERRKLGLPPLVGILRGMRHTGAQDVLTRTPEGDAATNSSEGPSDRDDAEAERSE